MPPTIVSLEPAPHMDICLSPLPLPLPDPRPKPKAKYLEEEALTQECKELLPTLPKDKGWVCNHLYQYQGFWHTTWQLQGVLATQARFKARSSDILLVTTPKSGTTWLKALVYTIVNRTHHSPTTDNPHHPLLSHNPHDLVPFLEFKVYEIDNVADHSLDLSTTAATTTTTTSSSRSTGTHSPCCTRIFATHLPVVSLPSSVLESGCKIVYLCRDPKDTMVSLWHFTNKLRPATAGELPLEEAFERFCRGVSLYGPFWDHVLGYWYMSLNLNLNGSAARPPPHNNNSSSSSSSSSNNNHNKVLFLKFEDLKADAAHWVKKLGTFLDCPFSLEEEENGVLQNILKLCSFGSLSNLEVNKSGKLTSGEEKNAFFRRGEVGDFANYLSKEMIQKMDSITLDHFLGSGLKF